MPRQNKTDRKNADHDLHKLQVGQRVSYAYFEAPAMRAAYSAHKRRHPGFNYKSRKNHLDCVVFECTGQEPQIG